MSETRPPARQATPLIPEQRRDLIVRQLRREGVLSFRQLTDLVGVSHMTIRRDIAVLAEEGRVTATPGGAKIASRLITEPTRVEKSRQDVAEKDAIAADAAALIDDSMTVYLDAGTTVQAMRPHLDRIESLTVVTNDLAIIAAFLDHPGVDLIAVGGQVEKANQSTVGRLAALSLRELSIDLAFLSSSSWDLRRGLTTPTESKVTPKQAAVAAASTSILLAASSKYSTFGRYRILDLQELDTVITDSGLNDAAAAGIAELGVSIVRAQPTSI